MKPRNIILGAGILLMVAFGGRAWVTDKDIPGNVQALLLVIITGGLAADPITEAAKRLGSSPAKKPEGEQ